MPEDDPEVPLTGAVKDKLIRTKEGWARDGRLLTRARRSRAQSSRVRRASRDGSAPPWSTRRQCGATRC